jgi:hypothetical protein
LANKQVNPKIRVNSRVFSRFKTFIKFDPL